MRIILNYVWRSIIERGNGNVFRDLGFPVVEAQNLLLRSQLMLEIRAIASDLARTRVAKRLGVTQPRLDDLLRGKIDKFRLDALVIMLNKAGMLVEVSVRKAA